MFICVVVVGGLLNVPRQALIAGLLKIWVPLLVASVAALSIGAIVGLATGLSVRVVLLRILIPAMVGGLTAGALPLAAAYAHAFNTASGSELAQLLPAVVIANLLAVFVGGIISSRDKSKALSDTVTAGQSQAVEVRPDETSRRKPSTILRAAALLTGVYLLGGITRKLLGVPPPLMFLVSAATLQLLSLLPEWLTGAVSDLYRACIRLCTFPLLLSVGLLLMPWQDFITGIRIANLAVLTAAIATLALVGAWVARWVGLPANDGAIVAVTRAAMGGAGDVAILRAAHRLDLMPFAQIATRIGGAATLALVMLALAVG